MGVILSVTVPPASIWMVHVGFRQGWGRAGLAGVGLASGHAFLAVIVGYCLYLVLGFWVYVAIPLRILSLLILAYLAWRSFRAKPLESLMPPEEALLPRGPFQLVQQSFYILVTMPMRVPAVFAYLFATAALYQLGGLAGLLYLGLGVAVGAMSWNVFFCSLGWVSEPRVEHWIILKSLNKLNRFAGYVYGILILITIFPALALL